MKATSTQPLPLDPLLHAYLNPGISQVEALGQVAGIGARFSAILGARAAFLCEDALDHLSADDFSAALTQFYTACVDPPLYSETLARNAGIVRHALGHVLAGADPLPARLNHCLASGGPYYIAGLGPAFWSAVLQGIDPTRHASWTPGVCRGLLRLGLVSRTSGRDPGQTYAAILAVYDRLRRREPALTALHIDHFLSLVATMQGRDLWSGASRLAGPDLRTVIQHERARLPLRRRLKERSSALHEARQLLEAGLAEGDVSRIGRALELADPARAQRAAIDWDAHAATVRDCVEHLWRADDSYAALAERWEADSSSCVGLWLPAAVLHLKDAHQFYPWNDTIRQGYHTLDDSANLADPIVERYRLFNAGVRWLCERYKLHPLEAPDVLAALAREPANEVRSPKAQNAIHAGPEGRVSERLRFGGFCADTFRFLNELAQNNRREWMSGQRDRYCFAVREPLVELCQALAERYIDPILRRQHGWDLETRTRSGHALTSICKNDFGRSVPYHTTLWITFYRRGLGVRSDDVQFFVRLDPTGLSYGLRLGRRAKAAGERFRRNVAEHAEVLCRALDRSAALAECTFGDADGNPLAEAPASPDGLRRWAAGKSLQAARTLPADSRLLTSDELVGDILLTFDRLLPAYLCAVEADPLPALLRRAGPEPSKGGFADVDFCRATFLGRDWLGRARSLLDLKRQLILQGVPGTGKTHVARCLARLLTGGNDDAVRLVQFHPSYSYEEFVEGIKVRSVEVNGRHDVTYPVEDGLLCTLAADAARQPAQPHVLIIDEINRGNLPRVFGELLYLLEYRDQAVGLPYSRRGFRLPANLYLIGTMNAADRSVALIDQALRRRFSFLDMPPDSAVLSAWLAAHPPQTKGLAERVVTLFERLNDRLRTDLGPHFQIGHSYFLVPDLDEARLRVVWEHHIQPLLEEYFMNNAGRAAAYDLDRLLNGKSEHSTDLGRRGAQASGS
jgi:hypothetical protein